MSPEAFLEYKTALYSAKFHPRGDGRQVQGRRYLIKVANTVAALKNNTTFQNDVEDGTFDAWAMKMSETFDKEDGVEGTPTLKMDGKKLTGRGQQDRADDGGRLQHRDHDGAEGLSRELRGVQSAPTAPLAPDGDQPKSGRTLAVRPLLAYCQ